MSEAKSLREAVRGIYVAWGIYVASKVRWAPRWRQLRADGYPIIATWIDEAEQGQTANWSDLWERCITEARQAVVTIIYADENEHLKGALVEVGVALGAGRHVIVFGSHRWTWEAHPLVTRVADEAEALNVAMGLLASLSEDTGAVGVVTPRWGETPPLEKPSILGLAEIHGAMMVREFAWWVAKQPWLSARLLNPELAPEWADQWLAIRAVKP